MPWAGKIRYKTHRGTKVYFIDDRLAGVILNSIDKDDRQPYGPNYRPRGCFIIEYPDGVCTAIDNSDGNAWTEDFHNVASALNWIVGDWCYEDYYLRNKDKLYRKFDNRINGAEV